ncbi:hypothetical protein [Kitasatospora sp. GP82]|uniref:hypothetical protein n=1 Tax=Kitasatospora sp. GP82 TaxID=3035089 RepID=UPI002473D90A|nr:hypothetical protein [Kitasatospora sp. GP82]
MTTQGERDPRPVGQQDGKPAHTHRGGGRRPVLVWCALAVVAATGAGWIATSSSKGDLIPGLGRTSSDTNKPVPAGGAASGDPLTEAQLFTAEHYFPAQKGIEQEGYKARRTAGKQGDNCGERLQDPGHDVLRDAGCQGYLAVAFGQADQPVATSVTVLRFADEASARKALQALKDDPGAISFLTPETATAPATPAPTQSPGAPSPQAPASQPATQQTPTQSSGAKPLTDSQVEAVGHYLTVTTSRYADLRASGPTSDAVLDRATRAVSFTAGSAFLWM